MAQWRLTFDVPYNFPVQRAFLKSQHCQDFNPPPDGFNNTWRCPVTGVVMLLPSFNTHDLATNFVPLNQFRFQPDFWQVVNRATSSGMMTSVKPANKGFTLIELQVQVAIIAILTDASLQDDLKWALESNFSLSPDESFAVHYFGQTDEMLRKNNWFGVQWDDCYFHFSHQGIVRVYQYNDRSNLAGGGYTQIDQFEIGSPGDFLNKQGYFIFMPIPTFGLAVYHYKIAQKSNLIQGSVRVSTIKGHLVKWPTRDMADKTKRLFESSPVRLAVNPYQAHIIGLERTVFPLAPATYTDAAFDPGLQSSAPGNLTPGILPTAQQNITMSLLNGAGTGPWTPGTDRAFRPTFSLATNDNRQTPFLYAYTATWLPQFATRNTTPLVLQHVTPDAETTGKGAADRLLKLEFSDDEMGRFEGTATVLMSGTQAQRIARRGDATFKLEYSTDGGSTWLFYAGGFAKDWKLKPYYMGAWGFFYTGTVALKDMWDRFRENPDMCTAAAFDGLTIGDAINAFLACAQQPPLSSIPQAALARRVPTVENEQFKFKPEIGEDGEKVLQGFLLFLHTQGVEWRMRFDWPNNGWILEQKPHDASDGATWTLSPFSADINASNRVWVYDEGVEYEPEPPEGNVFVVAGLSGTGSNAVLELSGILRNEDSFSNASSPDYLGRLVFREFEMAVLPTTQEADRMNRRMMAEQGHHRDKATLPVSRLQLALKPAMRVKVYNGPINNSTNVWFDAWIKARHVTVEQDDKETMRLETDTIWESRSRT